LFLGSEKDPRAGKARAIGQAAYGETDPLGRYLEKPASVKSLLNVLTKILISDSDNVII
jgi:hypothetical protein